MIRILTVAMRSNGAEVTAIVTGLKFCAGVSCAAQEGPFHPKRVADIVLDNIRSITDLTYATQRVRNFMECSADADKSRPLLF